MATIKPTWTENVENRASATLAAGTSDTNDIDLDTLGADLCDVQVNLVIGSSTGITVEVFGSPDSGTIDDTVPVLSFTMTATDKRSFKLAGMAYAAIKVTNDDGSNATGVLAIKFAWRQWNST